MLRAERSGFAEVEITQPCSQAGTGLHSCSGEGHSRGTVRCAHLRGAGVFPFQTGPQMHPSAHSLWLTAIATHTETPTQTAHRFTPTFQQGTRTSHSTHDPSTHLYTHFPSQICPCTRSHTIVHTNIDVHVKKKQNPRGIPPSPTSHIHVHIPHIFPLLLHVPSSTPPASPLEVL